MSVSQHKEHGPGFASRMRALVAAAFAVGTVSLSVAEMSFLAACTAIMGLISGALAFINLAREYEDAHADTRKTIVSLQESQAKMRVDPLTGHLNRTAFTQALSELAEIDSSNTMIVVMFFDLNRFKEVNDTLGHDIGDKLLQGVGQRATEVLNDPIAIARLGGDEFAAILRFTSEEEVRDNGEKLVKAISDPYELEGRVVEVSASLGIAIGDPAVHGGDELLRRADMAMYEVKRSGRGAYHIFDDLMSNRQMRENSLRAELGRSQFDQRFTLHYQPIVDARTGRTEKVEALLRSTNCSVEGVSPSLIVSVAEDSGQIVQLTEWTIDKALKAAATLEKPVAVNVSPIYFRHEDFSDRLIDRLIVSGLPPSRLIVEVTEGVLISDIESARESIDHLRALGIEVYLDDFGTGYSSLSYLQNFELDGMKLDKSFIQKLGQSDKAVQIIRSMVDFSRSLGMQTVVEGVESEWQARLLQLQGCDYLQGFHLGVPMPIDEVVARLAEENAIIAAEELKKANG